METIQVIARWQEIMAKTQEEMNQMAHVVAAHSCCHSYYYGESCASTRQHYIPNPFRAPDDVPPPVINPQVIKIDDQQDAFFSLSFVSVYDDFGPPANEVKKKVRAIEEKLKAMEGPIL